MHPTQTSAPLIVYIDVKSPYAFVAIEQILSLEADLGAQFDWRPLTLDIPSYLGSAKKKAGKVVKSKRSNEQWTHVRYAYRDARRYAEQQGLVLKGTEKIWDSSIANIAILWAVQTAREKLGDYLRAAYRPFWQRMLDIEDVHVIETCLESSGIASQGFAEFAAAGGEGRICHDELNAKLHDAGIFGVPTFVFDDKVLFGRQHLPLVRWHLLGEVGDAPDIALQF